MGLRVILILMAIVEAIGSIPNVGTLIGDMSQFLGSGLSSFLIKTHFATTPIFAVAALALAAMDHIRHAITALALIALMRWLSLMPSVVLHGLDFFGLIGNRTVVQIIAFPLMAICAIVYATRNERLVLSTLLVSLPIMTNLFFRLALFAISIAIASF